MSSTRKILWWIYGLQAFVVVPWLLGAIARGEMPFWPWVSHETDGWAVGFDIYLHLIFYSAFLLLPYSILSAAYRGDVRPETAATLAAAISIWILATVCLFNDLIFAFWADFLDSNLPAWHQWLHILWVAFTVATIILWRSVSKEKSERRERFAVEQDRNRWMRDPR